VAARRKTPGRPRSRTSSSSQKGASFNLEAVKEQIQKAAQMQAAK